jgi:hypothetical protein
MNYKKRINETNFMRRMMGLQPINEKYGIDAAGQKQMQLVSNVMTPEGNSIGGINTVPFKDSEEGKEWAAGDKKVLSSDRLEYATKRTIEDSDVGGWKVEKTGNGVIIKDNSRDFFSVETVTNGNPNWSYVVIAGSGFPNEYKDKDFDKAGVGVYAKSLKNYEEYATFLEGILHKHSPMASSSKPSPSVSSSWCKKRKLDIDWYFGKLKMGKDYLKYGDCGEAVEVAQDHMNEYEGSVAIKVDGKYGNDTIDEVEVVQGELGLTVDGKYGKKTHDALIRAIGAGNSPGAPIATPKDDMERMKSKPVQTIDTDIEARDIGADFGIDVGTDVETEFDFDRDVKDGGKIPSFDNIEDIESEFENKAKEKVKKRRGLGKIFGKRTKGKPKYKLKEEKTMRIKKNGEIINLTESDLRRIVKKVIK